jgi:two-component system, chemotaxis family, sensor kinase CheA
MEFDTGSLLPEFIEETRDNLKQANACILALEKKSDAADLDALFRIVHTIKGNCGVFSCEALIPMLQTCEDLLGRLRDKELNLEHDMVDDLLAVHDVVGQALRSLEKSSDLSDSVNQAASRVYQQIRPWLNSSTKPAQDNHDFLIELSLHKESFYRGEDALAQLRHLPGLISIRVLAKTPWPSLDKMDAYEANLVFHIQTKTPRPIIESHLNGLSADIRIIPNILTEPKKLPPQLIQPVRPPTVPDEMGQTLRVGQERIDKLMDMAGELIAATHALPYIALKAENEFNNRILGRDIRNQHALFHRLAQDMQNAIMDIRMLRIDAVFQRMPRLVRDTAARLGKTVSLDIEGEDTAADKHIVEALMSPLIHIIRNALDHGLEPPEERLKLGKTPYGKLSLRARQLADRIVIDVEDDGRGINTEALKQLAIERGILDNTRAATLSDNDAAQLIFAAGMSTAKKISDISGRGVGMDAVRNLLDRLRGEIQIRSERGRGTLFRLLVPRSMAVTRVMLIELQKQLFAIPIDAVVETVRLSEKSIQILGHSRSTLLRNRVIPLIDLCELLKLPGKAQPNENDAYSVLIVRNTKESIGLLVDDFRSTMDIIIKPLDGVMTGINGYVGTAVLGDGRVLLVLNPREWNA